MLQQAEIVRHAVAALGDGAETGENPAVQLAGIGLAADIEHAVKAEAPHEAAVQLLHLSVIPVEQLQQAGLRAGGAAAAQERNGGKDKIQLLQIGGQILQPEGGPLAHGDQLGGLIMRIAQGGQGFGPVGKGREISHDLQQLAPEIAERVPVENQVRVVRHIAGGGAEMDDAGGFGRRLAVGIDMRHDIMADLLFPGGGHVKIDVLLMGLQRLHLGGRDGQPQLAFGPGQLGPEPAPGADPGAGGEKLQHIGAGIAGGEGGFILVVHDDSFQGR